MYKSDIVYKTMAVSILGAVIVGFFFRLNKERKVIITLLGRKQELENSPNSPALWFSGKLKS